MADYIHIFTDQQYDWNVFIILCHFLNDADSNITYMELTIVLTKMFPFIKSLLSQHFHTVVYTFS